MVEHRPVSALGVRPLFGQIDAMGGKRGRVSIGSNSDRQTLNQLLACMDGFEKNEGVIVIGTWGSWGWVGSRRGEWRALADTVS